MEQNLTKRVLFRYEKTKKNLDCRKTYLLFPYSFLAFFGPSSFFLVVHISTEYISRGTFKKESGSRFVFPLLSGFMLYDLSKATITNRSGICAMDSMKASLNKRKPDWYIKGFLLHELTTAKKLNHIRYRSLSLCALL